MSAITTLSFGWVDIAYDNGQGYTSVVVMNYTGLDPGFWQNITPTLIDLAYHRGTRHIKQYLLPLAGQTSGIDVTVLITGMQNFHDPNTLTRRCCSKLIDIFRERGGQLRFESVPPRGLTRLTMNG